jgi:hypothetical protein
VPRSAGAFTSGRTCDGRLGVSSAIYRTSISLVRMQKPVNRKGGVASL